jgi:hypothetical protein
MQKDLIAALDGPRFSSSIASRSNSMLRPRGFETQARLSGFGCKIFSAMKNFSAMVDMLCNFGIQQAGPPDWGDTCSLVDFDGWFRLVATTYPRLEHNSYARLADIQLTSIGATLRAMGRWPSAFRTSEKEASRKAAGARECD